MPVIIHEQFIQAPIEVCFDLARNVKVHTQTTHQTNEKAVGGVTEGMLEEGDIVIWEAVHFGIKQRLTSQVTFMEKPNKFIDEMVHGAFHSFKHIHQFVEKADGTLMIDTFQYKSPLGILGVIADKLFLEKYMTAFIILRAKELKKMAERVT
ncbi:SRPBCC family protein [Pseudobacillus sp. FSL P4-0506]|uniref:SRPBCC family protein n=1 Tax=unclassified Pseudobacillus TaxID=2619284 RepID=UPI0030FBBCA5